MAGVLQLIIFALHQRRSDPVSFLWPSITPPFTNGKKSNNSAPVLSEQQRPELSQPDRIERRPIRLANDHPAKMLDWNVFAAAMTEDLAAIKLNAALQN
jgi:hypothetical protein